MLSLEEIVSGFIGVTPAGDHPELTRFSVQCCCHGVTPAGTMTVAVVMISVVVIRAVVCAQDVNELDA